MGKPALDELVDELEAMGLVERVPDPSDGRAKLVVPTTRGSETIAAAAGVIADIEQRMWLCSVGMRTTRCGQVCSE